MSRLSSSLGFAALLLSLGSLAFAGDEKGPAKGSEKEPETAAPAPAAPKGPEIAWARHFAEAREEAMERNLAFYVHSHGST